ncbi:MAG: hypothetical protein IPH76_11205 [Xanthomonadales bacterium]|nr:hypothetical protein [Xanthomonadales bacterium]
MDVQAITTGRRGGTTRLATLATALALALGPAVVGASQTAMVMCPGLGWAEGLGKYQAASAAFPTDDTPPTAVDCNFHQWSWEAFVWATALDGNGVPRFMSLQTPNDLFTGSANKPRTGMLKLAARSNTPHGMAGFVEGAGAIVEADGNMLVASNGYPVYASVHMNPTYFATAQKNLIATGGYTSQPPDSYFNVGDAVFKATWLRLDPGQSPPPGAFTTQAQVPVLHVLRTKTSAAVTPNGQYTTVTVALVGLHVVGYTINHPEFLWATFEHRGNAPMLPDNSFATSGSSPNNYTFYKSNTPFSQVNLPNSNASAPTLSFDLVTQKFSPPTMAVQENRTGGEDQPGGPQNIAAINSGGQSFLKNEGGAQAAFANYQLIGTVWMQANTYSVTSNQTDAIGSVNLANTTAETFVQQASNADKQDWQNCFSCHNATSYNFQTPPPPQLPSRRIAISHVLGEGTAYAVPNVIPVKVK